MKESTAVYKERVCPICGVKHVDRVRRCKPCSNEIAKRKYRAKNLSTTEGAGGREFLTFGDGLSRAIYRLAFNMSWR